MKILITATVQSHICQFHKPNIKMLRDYGYEVHIAAKDNLKEKSGLKLDNVDRIYDVHFSRSPFSLRNIKAFRTLKKIIKDNEYDIVQCNTPMGGVLSRIAVSSKKTKIIYTAHGFHFFKGAPLKNWLFYFPIEWLLSFKTDVLICINKEDYNMALNHLHAKKTEYIHGVGVDTEKIFNTSVNRTEKRKEIGISDNDFVVLSVGELNDNKNHETILKAISRADDKSIKYVICGNGPKAEHLNKLAKSLDMEDRLILLGYRRDIPEICKACDLFAFPSKREGLGMAALEAMASGLPMVGSKIHGILDYLENGKNGFSCSPCDVESFSQNILELKNNISIREQMKNNNLEDVKNFDIEFVEKEMKSIYEIE